MLQRYASAAAVGTGMTLGLFYVMQILISMQVFHIDSAPRKPIVLHPVPEDTPVRPIEELPTREQLAGPIDPAPTPQGPESPTGTKVGFRAPQPPGPEFGVIDSISADGPLVAMFRVEPAYPPAAIARGLEGHVVVEFDVMPDGRVTNVRVLESSHAVFENNAIKAAERFRFKARVVDGVAQASYGLRNLFRFRMND